MSETGVRPRADDQRFELLIGSIRDYAVFMLDPSGRVATWNPGAALIKGYSADEIIGRDVSIFYTPEDVAAGRPKALRDRALAHGRAEDEGWRVRKDGTRFWADVVITPIRDSDGALEGFVKVTRDLSVRHAAAERVAQSEASLSATLYSIGDGVLATDERGQVTRMNPVAERLTGWSEREAVGRPISEVFRIVNAETREAAANPVTRVLAEGIVVGLANHTALVSRDGTERPIADSGAPIRDANGVARGAVLVFRDTSAEREAQQRLKQAQEQLRQSEENLRATLYSIGDGVLATDERGRVTRVNGVAERLTGWRERDAIGRPIEEVFDIVSEDTGAKAVNPVARVLAEGIIVGLANHTALISRDGTERPIADSGAPIFDVDGKARGAVLVFRDVSDERRAEQALRESEEKLRLMIASVGDHALYMLDANGRVASWNPGAERIKGYREAEILGESFAKFFTPEDLAQGKPATELAVAASLGHFEDEAWRVRKDGSRFWANVILTPMRDELGRLVGFVKITRDLTARREAEAERLRLVQSLERIRLRDEFLSIASHELRTPLTALQLQLELLRDQVAKVDVHLTKNIDRAIRSGDRLAHLIGTLLDVSRIATGNLTLQLDSFDLTETVREVVERFRASATAAGGEIDVAVSGPINGLWDRLRIEQILMNLIANAIQYAAGTRFEVSACREGDDAVLEVRDRGPGIPEADIARIFDRFERATPARHYGGLGLGLYVARQIAEAHGGTILATNRPGAGACFTVRLPIQTRADPASQCAAKNS